MAVGSPNMGVQRQSDCPSAFTLCRIVAFVEDTASSLHSIQQWLAPAGYWRSTRNFIKYQSYLRNSKFLPYLNNEREHELSEQYRTRFMALDGAMFVRFQNDTTVYPGPGELFQDVDPLHPGEFLTLNETFIWKNNSLGFHEMYKQGKLDFATVVSANHLHIVTSTMQYFMIPYLYDQDWRTQWKLIEEMVRRQDVFTETEVPYTPDFVKQQEEYDLRGEVVDWSGTI